MFIRSPLARLDRRSRAVLPLGHRPRHDDGLCVADVGRDGVRLFRHRGCAEAPVDRPALGVAGIGARRSSARSRAIVPVALGRASVLYTFYPPLIGNPFYYIGVVLVVVGSWIWVALMSVNLYSWKRDNPGAPVPFPMFATVAGSYLWGWTAVGAALELLFQIIPVALGLRDTIDAGLARVFFSWTLHAIVYFWLMPSLHRLLHDRSAGDRRPAVQRHDGADLLYPVPRRRDADRHPSRCSRTRRSGPASSSCIRCSPHSSRCRPC